MVFSLKLFICIIILLSSVSSLIPPAFLSRDAFLSHATAFATSLISVNLINVVESVADSSGKRYITTPEGMKYMVTKDPKDSSSTKPVRAQKVKASYTLYLNGFPEDTPSSKKVDSSKGMFGDVPFEFIVGVSQVIKGWDISVLDMRAGEARRLIVPSELGYGGRGAGGTIPGGSTLYFDIELIERGPTPNLTSEQIKWLDEHPL